MKILAISDIHSKHLKIMNFLKKNSVDLIIIAGDITEFGPCELGEEILNDISSFNIPVLAIPGNCDPLNIHGFIDNSDATNLHGRTVTIKELGICGFGGSNPTPFKTPMEFDEVEIYDRTKKVSKDIKDHKISILVTHVPPINTKTDVLPNGTHVGSDAIRRVVEELQPSINICGHIHESRAVDQIGSTIIINPGMLSAGYGCLINIDDSDEEDIKIEPEFIKIQD